MKTMNFYTRNGWAGKNYDSDLSTKDIASKVRAFAKKNFPAFKFSVTSQWSMYADSLTIVMKAGPCVPFIAGSRSAGRGYMRTMTHIKAWKDEFTPEAFSALDGVASFAASFRYDDSDGMEDYFDTNFYLKIEGSDEYEIIEQKKRQSLKAAEPEGEANEAKQVEPAATVEGLEVVDYSEKAIAVFGDTKAVKEELKVLGGKFNPALKYGGEKRAGWIFSKKQADKVRAFIAPAVEPAERVTLPEPPKGIDLAEVLDEIESNEVNEPKQVEPNVMYFVNIKINKGLGTLSKFVATKREMRPKLEKICLDIRNKRAIATNGYILQTKPVTVCDIGNKWKESLERSYPVIDAALWKKMCASAGNGAILTCKLISEDSTMYWLCKCNGFVSKIEAYNYGEYERGFCDIDITKRVELDKNAWISLKKWLSENSKYGSVVIMEHIGGTDKITFKFHGIDISTDVKPIYITSDGFTICVKVAYLLKLVDEFNLFIPESECKGLHFIKNQDIKIIMPLFFDDAGRFRINLTDKKSAFDVAGFHKITHEGSK